MLFLFFFFQKTFLLFLIIVAMVFFILGIRSVIEEIKVATMVRDKWERREKWVGRDKSVFFFF